MSNFLLVLRNRDFLYRQYDGKTSEGLGKPIPMSNQAPRAACGLGSDACRGLRHGNHVQQEGILLVNQVRGLVV